MSRERVVLRVVPATGFGRRHEDGLKERLRARLGPSMEIAVERVECLPRGAAGKLRAVVGLAGTLDTTWWTTA